MPRGSMFKFFREAGGANTEHNGRLIWPGTADGFPLRGDAAPDLRQEEFDNIPLALDYKSGGFDLWVPEQKAQFDAVMDRIVNGWYMQHKRLDRDTEQGLRVWLEWVQIYGETPAGKAPGAHSYERPLTLAAAPRPAVNREHPITGLAGTIHEFPLGWPQ